MSSRELRVLLVEDDAATRGAMRELLTSMAMVGAVETAGTTIEAEDKVQRWRPDLVLLDISLPDGHGFELARRLPPDVPVVFTTAYDHYAVAAFELHALDYLLKPVRSDRLMEVIRRAANGHGSRTAAPPPAGSPLKRIFVRGRERITPVELSAVERLEARDDYVAVYANGARYLVHIPLTDLLEQLDPDEFVRIHRSHAVNLQHVVAFRPAPGGRLQAELRSGAKVVASRDRSQALRSIAL